MASLAAKKVAEEIIQKVGMGEIPQKGKIQVKHGYSINSARSNKAMETKSYKETIAPFVDKMIAERDRLVESMKTKDLSRVDYAKHIMGVDVFTKNINLLSGEPTERTEVNQAVTELKALILEIRNTNASTDGERKESLPAVPEQV